MDELEVKSAELCKAILVLFRIIVQHLNDGSTSMFVPQNEWPPSNQSRKDDEVSGAR